MTAVATDAYATTLMLVCARAPGATVCPSEVARKLAAAVDADDAGLTWRSQMPAVHAAVDQLVMEGEICLSWKGQVLASRAGPYRIGRNRRD